MHSFGIQKNYPEESVLLGTDFMVKLGPALIDLGARQLRLKCEVTQKLVAVMLGSVHKQ